MKVEIDYEAVTVDSVRFDHPPTIQQLQEFFPTPPKRYPKGTSEYPFFEWVWDEHGIEVYGWSDLKLGQLVIRMINGDKNEERASSGYHSSDFHPHLAFSGSLKVLGIDVKQADSANLINERISKNWWPTGRRPVVHFVPNDKVIFHFAHELDSSPQLFELTDQERVLGVFTGRELPDIIKSFSTSLLSNKITSGAFCTSTRAVVSNRRLAIQTEYNYNDKKIVQTNLNDIQEIKLRQNIDAHKLKLPILKQWSWLSSPTQVSAKEFEEFQSKLPAYRKSPYHVLEINTRSQGLMTFVFCRQKHPNEQVDYAIGRLEDFVNFTTSAISKYRGKFPDLVFNQLKPNDVGSNSSASPNVCPQCGAIVGSNAYNCAKCNYRFNRTGYEVNLVTGQKTSPRVKRTEAITLILFPIVIIATILAAIEFGTLGFILGVIAFIVVFGFWAWNRVMEWWYHK